MTTIQMDLFPDFDELGIWRYLVPAILLIGVFIPVWHWVGRTSGSAIGPRLFKTMLVSGFALFILVVILLVIGFVVFRLSNPSLVCCGSEVSWNFKHIANPFLRDRLRIA